MFTDNKKAKKILILCLLLLNVFLVLTTYKSNPNVIYLSFFTVGLAIYVYLKSDNKKTYDFTVLDQDPQFCEFIKMGEKIQAIKQCRALVNCGLKEALDYVESKLV